MALMLRLINVYYASAVGAGHAVGLVPWLRNSTRLCHGSEAALTCLLLPHYACFPRRAASAVYSALWCSPSPLVLQSLFAPLRWPRAVQLSRRLFGTGIRHDEHTIRGVKVTVLSLEDGSGTQPTLDCILRG